MMGKYKPLWGFTLGVRTYDARKQPSLPVVSTGLTLEPLTPIIILGWAELTNVPLIAKPHSFGRRSLLIDHSDQLTLL
jgi:hypothetical protein